MNDTGYADFVPKLAQPMKTRKTVRVPMLANGSWYEIRAKISRCYPTLRVAYK